MPVRISKNRVALENIPLNQAIGASIASAATINLTTATGNTVHLTGTTTITAVTLGAGMTRNVIFDGVLTLTHHATNNNLPSGANITTAANDRARYISDGTTVYCVNYQKADGTAVVLSVAAGTIIQVQSTTKGDVSSTTSGSLTDITGYSVSITPAATANKILVRGQLYISSDTGSANIFMQLFRDTTKIAQGSRGVGGGYTMMERVPADAQLTPYGLRCLSFEYLDSPSTTSATTYKMQISTNGGTVYVNGPANTGGLGDVSVISTITAMEVKG